MPAAEPVPANLLEKPVPTRPLLERPLLERVGVRSLERWTAGAATDAPANGEDADGVVHLLDERERRALRRIERQAIARAGLVGALSAAIAAVAEVLVLEHQESRPLLFWLVVGGASAVAAVLEIAFLSWDALRSVHAMSVAAGVITDERFERQQVLTSLARAALEVPNPPTTAHGLDAYRETSKAVLVAAALVYKLKVSATNVVLKQVVRRALGRAALRSWLVPFVAVPVTALWNAVVSALVLREARVRIFGPSLAHDVVARLLPPDAALSPLLAEALPRAVGACVVRSADAHPNLEQLLDAVVRRCGTLPPTIDDSRAFLALLPRLSPGERDAARRLLRAACVIDGRIARRERVLLAEAAAAVGQSEDMRLIEHERSRMLAGEPLALP